jgi:hypothetical protein
MARSFEELSEREYMKPNAVAVSKLETGGSIEP